jgi:DNA-binding protein HU-beta
VPSVRCVTAGRLPSRVHPEGKLVNKSQLVDALAARYEGNRKQAAHALESVLDTITREVAKGEKVAITGFGSFEKRVREARWVRNPRTGERIKAKKTAVPKFNPGADLKAVVSGAKKLPKQAFSAAKGAVPAKKSSTANKTTAAKSTAKKAPAKAAAKKSAATKSTAQKASTTKKTAAKKAPAAKKSATKTASKTAAKKGPAAKKSATKTASKTAAKKAPATKATAKKSTAKKSTAKKTAKKS